MKSKELCEHAEAFATVPTCYDKGFWGQKMTQAEYDRILKMYPVNAKYGNEKYIGSDVFPFDCICFLKALLGGATTERRLSYPQMASNPVGDCTNITFKAKLKNRCMPGEAKPGYGLATDSHCALALGNGMWIDCNWDGIQNGVKIHTTGIGAFDVAGEIPGVDYEEEKDEVQDFLSWLYRKWKEGGTL